MKFIKKFLIALVWIIILNLFVALFYGFFFENDFEILKEEVFFRMKYYSRKVIDKSLNYNDIKDNKNNVITEENISIKITNIDYEQASGNLKLSLEFYTNDGQDLENVGCMLKIHDNKNIFYNDRIGCCAMLIDSIDNLIYVQNLHSKLWTRGLNTIEVNEKISGNINFSNSESRKNIELNLDLEDNYKISNKVNIKILDLIYMPFGDFSYKPIDPLGEFRFTINF